MKFRLSVVPLAFVLFLGIGLLGINSQTTKAGERLGFQVGKGRLVKSDGRRDDPRGGRNVRPNRGRSLRDGFGRRPPRDWKHWPFKKFYYKDEAYRFKEHKERNGYYVRMRKERLKYRILIYPPPKTDYVYYVYYWKKWRR